jgi:hypothetical protein
MSGSRALDRAAVLSLTLHGAALLVAWPAPRPAASGFAPSSAIPLALIEREPEPAAAAKPLGQGAPPPPRARHRAEAARRQPAPPPAAPAAPPAVVASDGDLAVPAVTVEEPGDGVGPAGGAGHEAAPGGGDGVDIGRGTGRARQELAGRVAGSGPRPSARERASGEPYVSLREATSLRQYDFFPRLPAGAWGAAGPYVVAAEICVSAEGTVSEATLMTAASPQLDPVVLDAIRTWRYRPRLIDGAPGPFCHRVTIKYERP